MRERVAVPPVDSMGRIEEFFKGGEQMRGHGGRKSPNGLQGQKHIVHMLHYCTNFNVRNGKPDSFRLWLSF